METYDVEISWGFAGCLPDDVERLGVELSRRDAAVAGANYVRDSIINAEPDLEAEGWVDLGATLNGCVECVATTESSDGFVVADRANEHANFTVELIRL